MNNSEPFIQSPAQMLRAVETLDDARCEQVTTATDQEDDGGDLNRHACKGEEGCFSNNDMRMLELGSANSVISEDIVAARNKFRSTGQVSVPKELPQIMMSPRLNVSDIADCATREYDDVEHASPVASHFPHQGNDFGSPPCGISGPLAGPHRHHNINNDSGEGFGRCSVCTCPSMLPSRHRRASTVSHLPVRVQNPTELLSSISLGPSRRIGRKLQKKRR